MRLSVEELAQPISEDMPCGENLEYDPAFQKMEIMMQTTAEQEHGRGKTLRSASGPDWKGVRTHVEDLLTRTSKRQRKDAPVESDDISIEGVGNLLTSIAGCCQPVPGDPVLGYITQLRGVTIHREDCGNVLRWQSEENPRLLEVSWGRVPEGNYRVEILIRAYDRRELIKDISVTLSTSEASVTDISSQLDEVTDEVVNDEFLPRSEAIELAEAGYQGE